MTRLTPLLLVLALICWNHTEAQTIQTYENGPIHEAFVSPISANLLLDAVEFEPPEPINERIPRQLDIQSEWIAGYWQWDLNANDFVWVSGVWRRPPPGHQWIQGFWKKYDNAWVRIPGYWSRQPEQYNDYISIPPPDALDENMAPPPSSNYFWVSGHWYFMFDSQEYYWVPGNWEELDPQWVLVLAHYAWRPGGYVYVPAYWDWPVEERGTAYASVLIDPDYRYRVVYEPILILDPNAIVKHLFLYYPDYLCFLHHHYHYHVDFWHSFCCMPPWWSWDTWWGFTWHDHWSLWWWYTHPGYPQPLWMTKEISGILPAPLSDLLSMFSYVDAPLIVTPNGVVSRIDFLHALSRVTESDMPIVPDDKKVLQRTQQLARPVSIDSTNILKPLGRRLPINPNAVRPNVRKPVVNPQSLSGVKMVREDLKPRVPFKPRIPSHRGSPRWNQDPAPTHQPPLPPVRRPTWTPSSPRAYPPVQTYPDRKPRPERGSRPWKPRHQWGGEPAIHRPPIHKPRDRRHPKPGGSMQVPFPDYDHEDEYDRSQHRYPREGREIPQTGTIKGEIDFRPGREYNPPNGGGHYQPREGHDVPQTGTIKSEIDYRGNNDYQAPERGGNNQRRDYEIRDIRPHGPSSDGRIDIQIHEDRRRYRNQELQPEDANRKGSQGIFFRSDSIQESN